jgi:hypothetical protein
MKLLQTLFVAAAVAALVSSRAVADPPDDRNPNSPGLGWASGQESKGVPGPVAGTGIAYLLLTGGYAVFRRHRKRKSISPIGRR